MPHFFSHTILLAKLQKKSQIHKYMDIYLIFFFILHDFSYLSDSFIRDLNIHRCIFCNSHPMLCFLRKLHNIPKEGYNLYLTFAAHRTIRKFRIVSQLFNFLRKNLHKKATCIFCTSPLQIAPLRV